MIIKGLFRRYERWNPVHPTLGAFWGIGVGIGCGVGWGPGFGPEAIGYVGAGCGAGFSVGVTLAGFGIGLPANYVYALPYNALMAIRTSALEVPQSRSLISLKSIAGDASFTFAENFNGLQRRASEMFSSIGNKNPLENGMSISEMRTVLFSHAKPVMNQFERISRNFFPPPKGSKD
ncbi:OLC1v1031003C1 [Oldenlandia corymbosa var. corymbosa]|uniref:OLC1v1031003C1 n=1 Tax=Oldenlandia corymbosa var. corymbosa TaxID=529605 RepID=A0AAV1CI69_OLDCO|nr:OLC1v1031003C1 [Oldenlandia corymbosa var. corymbosa]